MRLLFSVCIVFCCAATAMGQSQPRVKVLPKGLTVDSIKGLLATQRQNNSLGQQFYTLQNGNKVYTAPQDHMPIIVPKATGTMPVVKVDPNLLGMIPNPYTIPKADTIQFNKPNTELNK
jgi:hypothetical protein